MSALTLVVLLRALDTSAFAFVVLLLNVGQFMGSAATGGLRLRYARLEAERISRGEEEPSAFHANLVTGSILVLTAGAVGLLGATVLGLGGSGGGRVAFVVLGTAFTLATAAVEMAIFHHQAQLSFTRAGLIEVGRSALVLLVAFAAALGILDTGDGVALGIAVVVGIQALIVSVPLAIATRGAVRGKDGRFGFGRETAALTFYSIASAGWAFLDLFLVAGLLNDVAVASYGASLRYISLVMGPVPALIAVLRVRTSQSDMVDSEDARRDLMKRWVRQTFWPAVAIIGGGAAAAIWVIPLINGGRYPLSVPIFQVLLTVTFVQYLFLPAPGLLIAQKRYSTIAWVNVVAIVVNVAAAAIAAPLIGVVGVAVAGSTVGIVQVLTIVYLALWTGRDETPAEAEAEAATAAEVSAAALNGGVPIVADAPSPSAGADG